MQNILLSKLYEYISDNNPELLLQLEDEGKLSEYLVNKTGSIIGMLDELTNVHPAYITEEACMVVLTEDLRPSKFNYIRQILLDEFESDYTLFMNDGTLQFELINLIQACNPVFETIGFTEANEDSIDLKNVITGTVSEYLESNKVSMKIVSDELQQTTKISR